MDKSKKGIGKDFYSQSDWDEKQWIEIIAIEYESLVGAYPFGEKFSSISQGGQIKLLDVGCGSAIFPRYLDGKLEGELLLSCDLLDISEKSLIRASEVMEKLEHFTPGAKLQTAIEDIPSLPTGSEHRYDVIWAIHSFTTVDRGKMAKVFENLRLRLKEGGLFFLYQLTSDSAYQRLHRYYFEDSPDLGVTAYMQFEDSTKIMKDMKWDFEVRELQFEHRIPSDDKEGLTAYLQKLLLNKSIDPLSLFGPILPEFREEDHFVFPQAVNLMVARKDKGSGN